MNTTPSASRSQLDTALARLRQRALDLGMTQQDDETMLEAVLQHDIQTPLPDEGECRRYYAQHPEILRQGDMVEADHILFAITPTTPIDALRAKAEDTLFALLADDGSFAELARGLSNCPSAQVGGNLGQLTADQCVPEFWHALIAHGKPGLLPHLVRTRFGLHIVRIGRIAQGTVPPFAQARSEIERMLQQQSLLRALQLYAQDLQAQEALKDEPARSLTCPAPTQ